MVSSVAAVGVSPIFLGQAVHAMRKGVVVFSLAWIFGKGLLAAAYDVVDSAIRLIEYLE
jgi:hypothetical protein